MASPASPKKVVSSVFITLAAPHQANGTRKHPTIQSNSVKDKQDTAARFNQSDLRQKKEDHSPLTSHSSGDSKGWVHAGTSPRASGLQTPTPVQPAPNRGKLQEDNRDTAEHFPPSALGSPPSAQKPLSQPLTPGKQPLHNREVETRTPSSGFNQNEQYHGIQKKDMTEKSQGMCGFCRKPIPVSERAIQALNRTYHDGCFQCRSCCTSLTGKEFYNKTGVPFCEDCHQATLELCWACGEIIKDYVIRALGRAYHGPCFICKTCKQEIGERFIQGDVGEVYCPMDYHRKYAPTCGACNQQIIPKEDGTDSFHIDCQGRSYHQNCYRCEVCAISLSPEPDEFGCYPMEGKLLCKSCNQLLVSCQH